MNHIHIGRPGTRSEHSRPAALSSSPPAARTMMTWTGRCLWLAVRPVISAVKLAHNEQVRMWECVLATSGVAPLTTLGPLRWVRSIDGYWLAGSDLPTQDPAETGR